MPTGCKAANPRHVTAYKLSAATKKKPIPSLAANKKNDNANGSDTNTKNQMNIFSNWVIFSDVDDWYIATFSSLNPLKLLMQIQRSRVYVEIVHGNQLPSFFSC